MKMYLAGLNTIQLYVYLLLFVVLASAVAASVKMKHCYSTALFSADITELKDVSFIPKLASSGLILVVF